MYQVFISGYRLAEVSHGKPYYVYCIEVLESESGTRYFIERRYSEFNALHRTVCYFIASYQSFNICIKMMFLIMQTNISPINI